VREDLPRLDRLIHEKLRLGIISALAATPSLDVPRIEGPARDQRRQSQRSRAQTRGRRLRRLRKVIPGRVPKTEYKLTRKGRAALELYLNHMEALVRAMRGHR